VKALFIGGTGSISAAASRMAVAQGIELHLLNRGLRTLEIPGTRSLVADIHTPGEVAAALEGPDFDVIVDWIAYTAADVERDIELFRGRVKQYVFISSATVYQKPPEHYLVRETTPLSNPFWQYARDKLACETRLMRAYRDEGFPVTIVRPSMTYDTNLPIAIMGRGGYTLTDRLLRGLPVIVHGDGTALWVVTHADDLARGLLGLMGNERAVGEAFHITSDEVLTWNQIYHGIAEALGVEANMVHIPTDFIAEAAPHMAGSLLGDKTWSTVFDNSKIKSFVPGFEAAVPFRDGIRRTLTWYAADETRRRVDETLNADVDRILSMYGTRESE
jgi:nucleoside-diphosphate-sugar epimerase